jgi:O-glycosyl hydrolase
MYPERYNYVGIVIWHLRGGIVEQEETVLANQRLDKQVYMAMDTNTEIEELLEAVYVFYVVRTESI